MISTLYEQLGRDDAIATVVDRFYERLLENDRIAHFVEDVNMRSQRTNQTQFLSSVAGGPIEYSGDDVQSAHAHLDIAPSDFDVIATHLEDLFVQFADERIRLPESMDQLVSDLVSRRLHGDEFDLVSAFLQGFLYQNGLSPDEGGPPRRQS